MSSNFTPSSAIDSAKERDWAANLGLLDWDTTQIVFTKRSLIEFLKYTGTTVDTNFANIQKLPRYAKFGTFSSSPGAASATETAENETIATSAFKDDFKPSRRVRTAPGGQTTDIFSNEMDDDALSTAPPRASQEEPVTIPTEASSSQVVSQEENHQTSADFKPSRRVRTNPGGQSNLSNFWGTEEEPETFKPTRRVRQGPGGQDSISGLF